MPGTVADDVGTPLHAFSNFQVVVALPCVCLRLLLVHRTAIRMSLDFLRPEAGFGCQTNNKGAVE